MTIFKDGTYKMVTRRREAGSGSIIDRMTGKTILEEYGLKVEGDGYEIYSGENLIAAGTLERDGGVARFFVGDELFLTYLFFGGWIKDAGVYVLPIEGAIDFEPVPLGG